MPWGQDDGPIQGKEANQYDVEKLVSYLTLPQSKRAQWTSVGTVHIDPVLFLTYPSLKESTVDSCGYCPN